jgi:hypothetical protein
MVQPAKWKNVTIHYPLGWGSVSDDRHILINLAPRFKQGDSIGIVVDDNPPKTEEDESVNNISISHTFMFGYPAIVVESLGKSENNITAFAFPDLKLTLGFLGPFNYFKNYSHIFYRIDVNPGVEEAQQ